MRTRELFTQLCQAVAKADPDHLKKILAKGPDVNAVGDRHTAPVALVDKTPLWASVSLAARANSLSEIVPDDSDLRKRRRRYLRIIRLLIGAGADLEKRCHGSTPLRIACIHNDLEVAGILLARGADPNAEIHSALSKQAEKVGRKIVPGYYGTILHEIVSKGYQGAAAALIKSGADPNRVDHERRTALEIARDKGGGPILKLLQRASAPSTTATPPP